ncbi:MAG TPA: acyl-CoA dehydrogenase family protein [Thermodesulfobacteriota bacterium]|nr:acyl-CoA dehydrogenase family protein [Thermodesulfobacteriota bacterium]
MKDIERERSMIRAAAQKTAQRIVQPRAAKIDATGEFPGDLVEAIGKQGYLSLLLPESYGGTDGDMTSFCVVVEEIAKVCGSSSLLILSQGLGSLPILLGGNSSQKDRYFTEISEKNCLTAFALREPEGELEPSSIKTFAEKQGKDYLINGRKGFITHGSVANFYSVFAVTRPEHGAEGISAFVAEEGTPGLLFAEKKEKIGMRGSVTTDVIFEDCRVPQENRLGGEGQGWKIAMDTINMSRPVIGAQAVGIAQGALDFAVRYANERMQFGKPISSFQAIQFMISDMATRVEAARALVYKAASQIDGKLKDTEKLSAISKYFASEIAMKVTTDAVQILGGYGYMKEYPVERMMRDAKVTQIYEEANQIERWVVAQELLRV